MTTLTAPPPPGTRACPKCSQVVDLATAECPRCHVIIEKAVRAEADAARAREDEAHGWMGQLAAADRLAIKQSVERLEMWTGIETPNAYAIQDGLGNVVLHAVEEAGSVKDFLVRNWLESARPFTMRVETAQGETAFVIRRPFRLLFSEVEVCDVLGKRWGRVERQFSPLNRSYRLSGARPAETYEICGPFFRPWTFKIRRHGAECGVISKRWGGLRREMLTDADAFGIEFPAGISAVLKAVFLGAVFLIDFAHFEDNDG